MIAPRQTPLPVNITIRQLEVFVAVIEHGGHIRAAKALGLVQSSVSHSLTSLEEAVGGVLVTRGSAGTLTPLGTIVLPHARAAVNTANGLVRAVQTFHDVLASAPIRVGLPHSAARGALADLLTATSGNIAHIRVEAREGTTDEVGRWLSEGDVDAAVLVDPTDPGPGAVTIRHDELAAVLPAADPRADADTIALHDLLRSPLLVAAASDEAALQRAHEHAGEPYRPHRRADDLTTLLAMVEARMGVAILPSALTGAVGLPLTVRPFSPTISRHLVLTGPSERPWHPHVYRLAALVAGRGIDAPGTAEP